MDNSHIENDKIYAPFLLAASFNGLIKFVGSSLDNNTLYWKFTPRDTAKQLIDKFHTKTEPHIPARDLFEAIDTLWKQVAQARNGEIKNGEHE